MIQGIDLERARIDAEQERAAKLQDDRARWLAQHPKFVSPRWYFHGAGRIVIPPGRWDSEGCDPIGDIRRAMNAQPGPGEMEVLESFKRLALDHLAQRRASKGKAT